MRSGAVLVTLQLSDKRSLLGVIEGLMAVEVFIITGTVCFKVLALFLFIFGGKKLYFFNIFRLYFGSKCRLETWVERRI